MRREQSEERGREGEGGGGGRGGVILLRMELSNSPNIFFQKHLEYTGCSDPITNMVAKVRYWTKFSKLH